MSVEVIDLVPRRDPTRHVVSWRWYAALAVTVAAAAVRLALAAVIPLAPDETYYWEWSRHLAAGYFDHPPAIALMIHAGVALFGVTPFGVRFVPVLAGFGALLAVLVLARRLGGDAAALYAAIIAACLPLAGAGLVLATPDAPLLLTTAVTLLALERTLATPLRGRDALLWWTASGALLGASFASKYTAVLLPFGVLLAFILSRTLRARLTTPGPYIAVAVALVVFAPVVVWNARHDWVSFAFQFHHGLGAPAGLALQHELSLLGGQLALASPVLFLAMAAAVIGALRSPRDDDRFVLAVVAASTFLFFTVTVLDKRAEPNWPAPAYVPAAVLLALVAARPAWRKWVVGGCVIGGLMVLAIYVHALYPILPFPPHQDPVGRAYGWDALAASVDTAQSEIQQSAGVTSWVAGDRYQDASELAFHLAEHPTVFSLDLDSRSNQYALWPDFPHAAHAGDNLVVALTPGTDGTPSPVIGMLTPHFDHVRRGSLVELARGDDVHARRRIWILEGWRGTWPASARAH